MKKASIFLCLAAVVSTHPCPAGSMEILNMAGNGAIELAGILNGERFVNGQSEKLLLPKRRGLFAESKFSRQAFSEDCIPLPETLSVVLAVQRSKNAPFPAVLFRLGGKSGTLFITLDEQGAPVVVALSEDGMQQFCRASTGAVNATDGKAHIIVVTINMGSGLVRMYVDGRPEAASVLSFWRPRVAGRAMAVGGGAMLPLVLPRELTQEELACLEGGGIAQTLLEEKPVIEFATCLRKLRPDL